MKTLILFVLLSPFAWAQRTSLFEGKIESGGYGGPMMQVSSINGSSAVFFGGKGGWIINHSVILGGGGWGLVSNVPAKTPGPNGETQMMFGYGGLIAEYWHNADDVTHWSFSVLLGTGGLDYRNRVGNTATTMMNFFVAEPGVGVNVNITENFTVGATASYRVFSNFSSPVADSKDLEGGSIGLVAKFGKF